MLFGKEDGTSDVAEELRVHHIPDIACDEYGLPLVSSMFRVAQDLATNRLVCYASSDVILMGDFLPAVSRITLDPFLLVGQRWDLEVNKLLGFGSDWERELLFRIQEDGKLHSHWGIDYIVFPRGGLYYSIPPFVVGRAGWDDWIVYWARIHKVPVIDATNVITVIHQNHTHTLQGQTDDIKVAEGNRNYELMGGTDHAFGIRHADWVLTEYGMRHALSINGLCCQLLNLPELVPQLGFLRTIRSAIRPFYRFTRRIWENK